MSKLTTIVTTIVTTEADIRNILDSDDTDVDIPKPQMACVIREEEISTSKLRLGYEINVNPRMFTDYNTSNLAKSYVGEILSLYVIPFDESLEMYHIVSGNRRFLAFNEQNIDMFTCKILSGYGINKEDIIKAMSYIRWLEKEQRNLPPLASWIYYLRLRKDGIKVDDIFGNYNWGHTKSVIKNYIGYAKKLDILYQGRTMLEILNERGFGIKRAIEISKLDTDKLYSIMSAIMNNYMNNHNIIDDGLQMRMFSFPIESRKYDIIHKTPLEVEIIRKCNEIINEIITRRII